MDCDRCCLTELFAMPTAIALAQCTGILGWGCTRSAKVWQKFIAVWQLWNNATGSASAADATTNCMMVVFVWKVLINFITLLTFGNHLMKKMAAYLAPRSWSQKLRCLGVYIHNHIWRMSSHLCKVIACQIIQQCMHRPNVWLVTFICSIAMELRAMRTVISTAEHNIICFPQFFAHVLFPPHPVLVYCWGWRGLVSPSQIVWAPVNMGIAASNWGRCDHILGASFWYNPPHWNVDFTFYIVPHESDAAMKTPPPILSECISWMQTCY